MPMSSLFMEYTAHRPSRSGPSPATCTARNSTKGSRGQTHTRVARPASRIPPPRRLGASQVASALSRGNQPAPPHAPHPLACSAPARCKHRRTTGTTGAPAYQHCRGYEPRGLLRHSTSRPTDLACLRVGRPEGLGAATVPAPTPRCQAPYGLRPTTAEAMLSFGSHRVRPMLRALNTRGGEPNAAKKPPAPRTHVSHHRWGRSCSRTAWGRCC